MHVPSPSWREGRGSYSPLLMFRHCFLEKAAIRDKNILCPWLKKHLSGSVWRIKLCFLTRSHLGKYTRCRQVQKPRPPSSTACFDGLRDPPRISCFYTPPPTPELSLKTQPSWMVIAPMPPECGVLFLLAPL